MEIAIMAKQICKVSVAASSLLTALFYDCRGELAVSRYRW
jgi:hypothetical protein